MRCLTLKDLPPPPMGKSGWPWTVDIPKLPEAMPDGEPWPKISIVTPSFNQGQFIEETIRSVLLQGYPNLEYLIVDGGSSDQTVSIIKKYEDCLCWWVSERDGGQSNAINKGFSRATGEIIAWLNSDDTYEADIFSKVAIYFSKNLQTGVISGRCKLWYGDPNDPINQPSPLRSYKDFLMVGSNWMRQKLILQPEAFFRRDAFLKFGPLREDLYYCLDAALWMAMARGGVVFDSINEHWANLRMHRHQKTADLGRAYSELTCTAWNYLLRDWVREDLDVKYIANDIFGAMAEIQEDCMAKLHNIRGSTSFRLARVFTKIKFW